MKKVLLIIFCIFLIGCSSEKSLEIELYSAIKSTHKNYYLKWFKQEINEKIEKFDEDILENEYNFIYSYKDVKVMESYNKNTQKLNSYFIVSSKTNINSLIRLVVYHNCNVSISRIDDLFEKEEGYDKYGSCSISKYLTNSGISYDIEL